MQFTRGNPLDSFAAPELVKVYPTSPKKSNFYQETPKIYLFSSTVGEDTIPSFISRGAASEQATMCLKTRAWRWSFDNTTGELKRRPHRPLVHTPAGLEHVLVTYTDHCRQTPPPSISPRTTKSAQDVMPPSAPTHSDESGPQDHKQTSQSM